MTQRTGTITTTDRRDDGAFDAEHAAAWLFAAIAVGLAGIGLLVGFDVIGGASSATVENAAGEAGLAESGFWDGMLWLIPSFSSALLAFALHRPRHHARSGRAGSRDHDNTFQVEHALAYVMTVTAVATAVMGMLVGWDVFDNGTTSSMVSSGWSRA
jgi:hypothetical protein